MQPAGKATAIRLFDVRSVQMRTFHMAWIAFHVCFFGWFGIAPLMAVVREDLGLSQTEIGNTVIASVAGTVFVRLLIGPMIDRFGPRRVYTWLLILGAVPVMGIGLAQSYETFLLARLMIGGIGASFVVTQYHTAAMFAPNVVATASATTAGWGNLGGGAAQMLMPVIFALLVGHGVAEHIGWRLSMIVPGLAMIGIGVAYHRITRDTPEGGFADTGASSSTASGRASGAPTTGSARVMPPGAAHTNPRASFMSAARDVRVWALAVAYAASFGIELTLHNVAAIYYLDNFDVSLATAGVLAGGFGLLALFARTLGGWMSDRAAARGGLPARARLLLVVLLLEGAALMLFSRMSMLVPAVASMLLLGVLVHVACGATYGLVPFIRRGALGSVAGIVGAGGNAGAVAAGLLFRLESLSWRDSLLYLGVAVVLSAFPALTLRFSAPHETRQDRRIEIGPTGCTPARPAITGAADANGAAAMPLAAAPMGTSTPFTSAAAPVGGAKAPRGASKGRRRRSMRFETSGGGRERLVVVGNGMAGMRTVEELLKIAPDLYEITVFGAEPHGNYNRIMLSPLLAGEKALHEIMINTPEWYAANGITLHAGDKVVRIDRGRRVVHSESGRAAEYDRLLLATGSVPFIIPVPGNDLDGVITFRDIADVDAMLEAAKGRGRAVVIGGGLLGLEAASGLRSRGMDVTAVHLGAWLMERQLDAPAARMLQRSLESRGMSFRLGAQTREIVPRSAAGAGSDEGNAARGGHRLVEAGRVEARRVGAVRLASGEDIAADLVVMTAGIRPNTELARSCGLHCDRGVVVDDTMLTFDPRVYAVGECVQHRGSTYGLVAPLWEQARVAATHLARFGLGRYRGSMTSTKLKVSGIDVFSAGNFSGDGGAEEIVLQDAQRGVYKRLVLRDNRIDGAVLYGDTGDGGWYFQLMKERADISKMRDKLIFGRAFVEQGAANDDNAAASLPSDATVCDCNGVCKGEIVAAVCENGLTSVDAVAARTKAGTSCGTCQDLVADIVRAAAGDSLVEAPVVKPICACTEHGHEHVRNAIRERHLTTTAAVRESLGWREPDGCAKCRPALNYYCVAAWPGEAIHEDTSRFINERAHANIQKDGTYSVVPRMFGGVTTPRELRAIADVAEKYSIPTVKVTGGQRIDLLGVRKEDLPRVWRDLRERGGLVSGHAYAKALRTVKTCVGSEWCRFGLQDSTRLGIELERLTWGSWMPHKFKMAVSGCPRNCAEASIKDFGVVCLDAGYELLVGGNGGVKLRGADVLCRVSTTDDVVEHCLAFVQLYREEGHYLERSAPFVERVGLDYVKRRVVEDAAGRAALAERFRHSQKFSQIDPWEERSRRDDPVSRDEFAPLKRVS